MFKSKPPVSAKKDYSRKKGTMTRLLKDLEWLPLETRRKISRLTMLYKIINNLVAIPAEEFITKAKKKTRGHNQKYTQISFKKDYYGYTFFPRTIKEWNSLPSYCVESCSLKLFKLNLANHFGYKSSNSKCLPPSHVN